MQKQLVSINIFDPLPNLSSVNIRILYTVVFINTTHKLCWCFLFLFYFFGAPQLGKHFLGCMVDILACVCFCFHVQTARGARALFFFLLTFLSVLNSIREYLCRIEFLVYRWLLYIAQSLFRYRQAFAAGKYHVTLWKAPFILLNRFERILKEFFLMIYTHIHI